ncbi:hypothetical protein ACEQUB_p00821 (plasmid) [Ralstonia syzygii]
MSPPDFVVPWFWLATQQRHSQVFQNRPLADLLEQVLAPYAPYAAWRFAAGAEDRMSAFGTRSHIAQFRETDYHFVTRLLAEPVERLSPTADLLAAARAHGYAGEFRACDARRPWLSPSLLVKRGARTGQRGCHARARSAVDAARGVAGRGPRGERRRCPAGRAGMTTAHRAWRHRCRTARAMQPAARTARCPAPPAR